MTQDPALSDYASFARKLAAAARLETLPRFRGAGAVVDKEGPHYDPVTDADREAERVMRAMIAEAYPDHGLIGEEFGIDRADAAWRWVLDPVDGTRAFVCGAASWTTLIALERDGAPVLGLIDQPFTDECWIAVRDATQGGAAQYVRHGEAMTCRTSGATALKDARLSTTDPRAGVAYFSDEEAAAFERIAHATRLARFSFDAYAYGLVALGALDLVMETGLEHHDYASLAPVVEGAGGVVTNWRGEPLGTDDRGEILASATPALHEAALRLLS